MTSRNVSDPDQSTAPEWWSYRGDGVPHTWTPPPAPPWRLFDGKVPPDDEHGEVYPAVALGTEDAAGARLSRLDRLAAAYRAERRVARLVNAAIHLRRPLLVTGPPGTGKSMLAHSIAYELRLGRVLHWPITSRSTVAGALYQYDAVGRLQEVNLRPHQRSRAILQRISNLDIGRYIKLGPLGTALLPSIRPRVLLIDEIDKGDVDLPYDLLNVFEEGNYQIIELLRQADPRRPVAVFTDDGSQQVAITGGTVTCSEFPIVVLTSNGERDFPPAFVRRCIRLKLELPGDPAKLENIVRAHLGPISPVASTLISRVVGILSEPTDAMLAIDQLLNAIRMEDDIDHAGDEGWNEVLDALLRPLNDGGP
jgi:MoxR-like ATPase